MVVSTERGLPSVFVLLLPLLPAPSASCPVVEFAASNRFHGEKPSPRRRFIRQYAAAIKETTFGLRLAWCGKSIGKLLA
jgi:hypothetical protein